jgi:hypothetical protein
MLGCCQSGLSDTFRRFTVAKQTPYIRYPWKGMKIIIEPMVLNEVLFA